MESLADLTGRFPRPGRVEWIGLRPARHAAMTEVMDAVITVAGLDGDRARAGKRALTLIQSEHLPVITALVGHSRLPPDILRRNVVVSGINLSALRNRPVRLGSAIIMMTGPCAPCSRMETALGPGGYNAMRGHGGMTAKVLEPGTVQVGCALETLPDEG